METGSKLRAISARASTHEVPTFLASPSDLCPLSRPWPLPVRMTCLIQYLLGLGGPHFIFLCWGLGLPLVDEQAVLAVCILLSFASGV